MTSILIKFLSWWIPKRRHTVWHCSVLELLLAAWLFLFLPALTRSIFYPVPVTPEEQNQLDIPQTFPTNIFSSDAPNNSHPVVRLVQTRNWAFIGMAFYMACILAPINEELLFRGGLQNCLQGVLTKLFKIRLHLPVKTCRWLISIISIVLPAIIFALVHYRSEAFSRLSIEDIVRAITNSCIAWTLFPIICYSYLFFVRRLRPRDLFGTWRETPGLILTGVKWIWVMVPIYILMFLIVFIQLICKTSVVADPIGLLPLALIFGFLYYRTQSLLPSLALHILFNFISLSMSLLIFFL